jgi:hypothetical protein
LRRRPTCAPTIRDQYLLSVRVTRDQWRGLNFGNLAAVDPVEALGAFDVARSLQRGRLLAITPLSI